MRIEQIAMDPTTRSTATRRGVLAALLLGALAAGTGPSARPGGDAAAGRKPTRDDLAAARRQVDRLEGEFVLASTRKPYVVLDIADRALLVRLMGMTVRQIPLEAIDARGLRAATGASSAATQATSVAGIFTLREKEGDPRLSPLTPEQIEAGQDDENVADALPPDPPAAYGLIFKQPIYVRIEGRNRAAGLGGTVSSIGSLWGRLWNGGRSRERASAALRVTIHVDETTAREIYRTLVPGERFMVTPPAGLLLPEAGQEPPRSIRAARPVPRPTPAPTTPPGVPFRIPSPVEVDQTGAPGAAAAAPVGAGEPGQAPPADRSGPGPAEPGLEPPAASPVETPPPTP